MSARAVLVATCGRHAHRADLSRELCATLVRRWLPEMARRRWLAAPRGLRAGLGP